MSIRKFLRWITAPRIEQELRTLDDVELAIKRQELAQLRNPLRSPKLWAGLAPVMVALVGGYFAVERLTLSERAKRMRTEIAQLEETEKALHERLLELAKDTGAFCIRARLDQSLRDLDSKALDLITRKFPSKFEEETARIIKIRERQEDVLKAQQALVAAARTDREREDAESRVAEAKVAVLATASALYDMRYTLRGELESGIDEVRKAMKERVNTKAKERSAVLAELIDRKMPPAHELVEILDTHCSFDPPEPDLARVATDVFKGFSLPEIDPDPR